MEENARIESLVKDISEIASNSSLREELKRETSDRLWITRERLWAFLNNVSNSVQILVFRSVKSTKNIETTPKEAIRDFLITQQYPEDLNSLIVNREELRVWSLGDRTREKYDYILWLSWLLGVEKP